MGLGGRLLESILKCFGLQVEGLGSKLEAWEVLLEFILGLVGRKSGFGRPRGNREGVWKGLGWPRGGWGPANKPNMDPT